MNIKYPFLIFFSFFLCFSITGQTYSFVQLTDTYKNNKKVGDTNKSEIIVDGNRFATTIYMHEIPIITNIINYDSSTMTMITHAGTNKSGMVKRLPQIPQIDSLGTTKSDESITSSKESIPPSLLKRTEETKDVDGFLCRRYEMEGPQGLFEIWMLEGHSLDFLGLQMKMMSGMPTGNLGIDADKLSAAMPMKSGFAMETYTEQNDQKKSASLMRVVNLKIGTVDLSIFDLSDVELINTENSN